MYCLVSDVDFLHDRSFQLLPPLANSPHTVVRESNHTMWVRHFDVIIQTLFNLPVRKSSAFDHVIANQPSTYLSEDFLLLRASSPKPKF